MVPLRPVGERVGEIEPPSVVGVLMFEAPSIVGDSVSNVEFVVGDSGALLLVAAVGGAVSPGTPVVEFAIVGAAVSPSPCAYVGERVVPVPFKGNIVGVGDWSGGTVALPVDCNCVGEGVNLGGIPLRVGSKVAVVGVTHGNITGSFTGSILGANVAAIVGMTMGALLWSSSLLPLLTSFPIKYPITPPTTRKIRALQQKAQKIQPR